jgi:ABC-type spermidine/putrescine transport system permease subunit II
MAPLRAAATFFTIAVLVHNSDHLRRGGDSVAADVFWLGSAAILLEVAVVVLVFMRHPAAPLVATVAGFQLALGYLGVHFTPERTWFSDSFLDGGQAASWAAASLETVAALVLGVVGALALRRRDFDGTGTVSVGDALRHPVVAVMALGNAVVFVGSLLTR